ncbi:P-loop containing nucleoside triphosphate hydrolase protein [Dothidotthia symphoricarpi CBS 119687]|uniref:P-loop containing nucleoside triphosphate hydrolase protein n=1 Tax=Dothidotthia symphoricarpi CBS 119687 TaxID=1392245 RepID=A0A6A6AH27_9PLEO|nr:P-loop containing nucleoside triphosphate hydrolase protein [Dothidotthia symphoricarpi CBS 119687]KAF2131249.1 P-loop containing nucleoside triphosphate hydrolase protein [Dothidotthia symphoricarpi CBS 119687]
MEHIQKNVKIVSSKPHWLLLLDPYIAGYSLKSYTWGTFYVDYVHKVNWNDWAFGRLVFPEDSKDLLLTLVRSHAQVRDIGQDIVAGKGNGFVVLLSGPPGTGKTLTAEAVAEQAQRPFLRIQAETLGKDDEDLEEELGTWFRLATEWNAVLLIDEADAYLGNTDEKTHRSSHVRTFMTQLEYYSGVVLLTTNFPEKIDEAFSSRIDVHFEYPSLDRTARCKLLKAMTEFATSSNVFAQSTDLSEQDYWRLARWELNGRELKNAVKISTRLCSIKKEKLSYDGLETAIRHTAPRKVIESESSLPPAKRARLE